MQTFTHYSAPQKNFLRSLPCVFLLLCILYGCAVVSPQTTALQDIHQSYREEFTRLVTLPPSPQGEISEQTMSEEPFPMTLRAIRDFKVTYGEDTREAAHLTVLEGMIYLQSGRFGMAKLITEDVKAAQAKLHSGTGHYTRDELLAKSFEYLLQGWQEIYDFTDNSDDTIAEYQKLEQAAEGIKAALESLDASKIAQAEVDEGAIYLATTGAIFYVWVYKLKSDAFLPDARKEIWFTKGHELIGRYLSETEKKAAAGTTLTDNVSSGRLRYLAWYGYLLQAAQESP